MLRGRVFAMHAVRRCLQNLSALAVGRMSTPALPFALPVETE